MAQKIFAELTVVAQDEELEKSIASELNVPDGDLEALLNESEDTDDNSKNLPKTST